MLKSLQAANLRTISRLGSAGQPGSPPPPSGASGYSIRDLVSPADDEAADGDRQGDRRVGETR